MLVHHDPRATIYHCDTLADGLPREVDALIVDAPYSEKTHRGHDSQRENYDGCEREALPYPAWAPDDVVRAVAKWAPMTRGWFVSVTDHVLAPAWADALEMEGRYVFSPLAAIVTGSRVRLGGDGPAQWAYWVVVARPKRAPYSKWGALRGGYCVPREPLQITGGKPLRLMRQIVEDYSRPGELVCDPCCGSGTTLRAAIDANRQALGCDVIRAACELSAKRLAQGALALDVALSESA